LDEHEGEVTVTVTDNGSGIRAEDMTRIFQNGYTTKGSGGGYGLHYCANAAKELGIEMGVHSEGPGTGAAFTVRFPSHCVALSVEADGRRAA
jgi:sensor histidine kinase regulating citrate/malate metabolism